METYSLRLITDFLKDKNITFEYCNSKVGFMLYNHGCRIDITPRYKLSIQTHPSVIGGAFAETALQDIDNARLVYDGTMGYHDVKRFDTPEELFDHIKILKTSEIDMS